MPQWRKLHVKATESPDINDMPNDFARLLWILLPLALDREGIGMDNLSWVKSKTMPLRLDVSINMVSEAFSWYESRGMIQRYQVEGRRYFWVPTFRKYQGNTGSEAASEFPPPPSDSRPTPEPVESNSRPTSELVESNSRPTPKLVESNSSLDVDVDSDSDSETEIPPNGAAGAARVSKSGQDVLPKSPSGRKKAGNPRGRRGSGSDLGSNIGDGVPADCSLTGGGRRGPGPPAQEMFSALATVCCWDPKTLTSKQRGALNQSEKRLRAAGASSSEVDHFGDWWRGHDWRGKRGEAPAPAQVCEEWGRFVAWSRERSEYIPDPPETVPKRAPEPILLPDGGDAQEIWKSALAELRGQMARATFDSWLARTHVIGVENGTWVIGVQNQQNKEWLEVRLLGTIQRALASVAESVVDDLVVQINSKVPA